MKTSGNRVWGEHHPFERIESGVIYPLPGGNGASPHLSPGWRALACSLNSQEIFFSREYTLVFRFFRKSLVNPKPCAMMCRDARMRCRQEPRTAIPPLVINAGEYHLYLRLSRPYFCILSYRVFRGSPSSSMVCLMAPPDSESACSIRARSKASTFSGKVIGT